MSGRRRRGAALTAALAWAWAEPGARADDAPPPTASATPAGSSAPTAPMPYTLDYDEGRPIPPGYRVSSTIREGPLIAGGVMYWTGYVTSVVAASIVSNSRCAGDRTVGCYYDGRNYYLLDIPLAGPFLGIAALHPEPAPLAGLIALGTLQVAGAALALTGLVVKKKVLVRDASLSAGPRALALSLRGAF